MPNRSTIVGICGACSFAILVFLPTLQLGFVYDDHSQIIGNSQVQSWAYLRQLLVSEVWSQRGSEYLGFYYRPLFSLWLLAVHSIGGLTPWFWHFSSLILHVITTYVVFRLSLESLRSTEAAFVTASLFAIHPIHVEAVSWISASDEILFSLFFLTSFVLFARSLRSGANNTYTFWASVALWVGALLSKETAVALLPIFPAWAFVSQDGPIILRKRVFQSARTSASFIIAAMGYFFVRALVLHRSGLETGQHSWPQVAFTGLSLVPFYLGKLIYPVNLSPFYTNPLLSSPNLMVWLGGGLLVVGGAVLIWAIAQRKQLAIVSIGLITLPLIPVLVGVRIFRDGDMAHDRYLYLPSVAVCLITGALFKYFWAMSKPIRAATVASFAIVSVLFWWSNFFQQDFFRNDEGFFNRALVVGPTNSLVMTFLGDAYLREGKDDLAFQEFRQARDISPNDFEVLYHLARGLFETKRYAEAEPVLTQLVEDPHTPISRHGLLSLSLAQTEINLGKLASADSRLAGYGAAERQPKGLSSSACGAI